MHRFFVSKNQIKNSTIIFEEDIEHQINNVLRLTAGNKVIVFDNSGFEYLIELRKLNGNSIDGEIIKKIKIDIESSIEITLFQSILKSKERFEYILQKCTELGVIRFVPLITSRTIPRITSNWISTKRLRWEKIIREAAEQSGRVLLPELSEIQYFNRVSELKQHPSIILWEEEEIHAIRNYLYVLANDSTNCISKINVIVGPEGGFEKNEIQYAKNMGVESVSLGNRILRSDTAGIAAVSCVMYEFGQFSP